MLTCSTNSSLIVDSIELLNSSGERIDAPSRNVSSTKHYINGMTMNATYVCRVNSTLGSQSSSIFVMSDNDYAGIGEATIVTQSVTVAEKHSPEPNIPVVPIATASAGALLVLLAMFTIVCIISLR